MQTVLALVDVIAVLMIGLVISIAISAISNSSSIPMLSSLLNFLGLSSISIRAQAAFLGVAAATLLILKTILSAIFIKKNLNFLSSQSVSISQELLSKLVARDLNLMTTRPLQDSMHKLTTGVNSITLGIIGNLMNLLSDLAVLIFLMVGLVFTNLIMTAFILIIFSVYAVFVNFKVQRRLKTIGERQVSASIRTDELIYDLFMGFRELKVRGGLNLQVAKISKIKSDLAESVAAGAFIPFVTKYGMEVLIVFSALAITSIQFLVSNATNAFTVLAIYLAASSRIGPALMRVQQSAMLIKMNQPQADSTMELIRDLGALSVQQEISIRQFPEYEENFDRDIAISSVNLSIGFENLQDVLLNRVNFNINSGDFVAIVGSSGVGKSTLMDVLLGVRRPLSGETLIHGLSPLNFQDKFPGKVAYVPQSVYVTSGSLRENLAFGLNGADFDDHSYWKVLELTGLGDWANRLSQGLDEPLGSFGGRLSGGERQRLGIARGLLTDPTVIFLDEATSALDSQSERIISELISELKFEKTIIMIAHRLSSIRGADRILLMKESTILDLGDFECALENSEDFKEISRLQSFD